MNYKNLAILIASVNSSSVHRAADIISKAEDDTDVLPELSDVTDDGPVETDGFWTPLIQTGWVDGKFYQTPQFKNELDAERFKSLCFVDNEIPVATGSIFRVTKAPTGMDAECEGQHIYPFYANGLSAGHVVRADYLFKEAPGGLALLGAAAAHRVRKFMEGLNIRKAQEQADRLSYFRRQEKWSLDDIPISKGN